MNFPIQHSDLIVALLLLTFIPMIVTATFFVLCFHRAGYGWVGKLLVGGFSLLVGSLFLGLMSSLESDLVYRLLAGVTRITGWTLIAAASVIWYVELDRALP